MIIDIFTLFPDMFGGPFSDSLMARAQEKGLAKINIHDLREFGEGERRTIDDRPYGGGVGMIMKVEPIERAINSVKTKDSHVILLTPQGRRFNQKIAGELAERKHLVFICGRYEGFDQRIHDHLVDEEISIGDYVMMGGELPAMVIVETTVRLLPGVIAKKEATEKESFATDSNELEHPQYTRPENYKGHLVPKVLLSGDHKKIEAWKKSESLAKTIKNRPDLISQDFDTQSEEE
jgi:tRNA (guanine37-N1)-methyltransferase